MRYLVLWSGGLDSTALIHHLLGEGHSVDAVYVNIQNNLGKSKRVRVVSDSLTAKVRNLTITGYDGRVSYAIIEVV
jgi:diphthamide synthase (EF-2-diphthine--ammonia ligase)